LICLCPNHHVMFDRGTFSIEDNFQLTGTENGKLFVSEKHKIDIENIRYHRLSHGFN
jgi:putative restriction endonuclease